MTDIRLAIRTITSADMFALKGVIDANGLFPSDMLDEMTAAFFQGKTPDDIWLTVDQEGPIAVLYCAPEQMTVGTSNLYLIAVHPDRQGEGVGTLLIEHVEKQLKAKGQRILLVETSGLPAFERTRAFYQSRGFHQEARIREFYREGEDKIIFRKSLQTFD